MDRNSASSAMYGCSHSRGIDLVIRSSQTGIFLLNQHLQATRCSTDRCILEVQETHCQITLVQWGYIVIHLQYVDWEIGVFFLFG